ncbi:hypothetical protein [Micromonospora aurantiaca (nom. illeg.)]|uniref:hypothetical protein n=1 Tax=Micromonospora aurantiaca (nom. illeg.) TaxID=47850 RepID=UPI0033D28126
MDALGRLLLRTEASIHRGGWDEPARVLVLIDAERQPETASRLQMEMRREGRPVRDGGYLAQPMLGPEIFVAAAHVRPPDLLRRFAMVLAYGPPKLPMLARDREMLRSPGVVGFAIAHEAWVNEDPQRPEGPRLADIPGSYEARMTLAVTVSGDVVAVRRRRGQPPGLLSDTWNARGELLVSLRLLCDLATDRVPPAERFAQAYASLVEAPVAR